MPAKATHVVGGDLTYLYIGNNNYEITLKLYVDCVNGSALAILQDTTAVVVIYDTAGNLVDSMGIYRNLPIRVEDVAYSCVIPPPNACVDLYIYKDTVNLPPIPGGYSMAFQRCCRNKTLSNIINPLDAGSTYWTYISDTTNFGYNSSPVFDSLPPNFLCNNFPLIFDHGATDPDGDSLVYELCQPFDGDFTITPRPPKPPAPPYPNVIWRSPYSNSNVMGGSPILTINSETGLLKVTPDDVGQFVVGICVKEYRDGILIGRTMRDYQLNVLNCNFTVVSSFASPDLTCSRDVFFNNFSNGADTYDWDFGVTNIDTDTSTEFKPTYTYPDTGNYTIRLIAKSGNCIDTFHTPIHVVDKISVFAGNDTNMCIGDTIQLGQEDFSGFFTYAWQGGGGLSNYSIADPKSFTPDDKTYIVTKTRGNCSAKDTVSINVLNPKAAFTPQVTCKMEVQFDNNSTGATTYHWDFNDPTATDDTSLLKTPEYIYPSGATYTVTLRAINGECYHDTMEEVTVYDNFNVFAGRDTFLCPGEEVELGEANTNKDFSYSWEVTDFLDNPTASSPKSTPTKSIVYVVTKTAGNDCEAKDTVEIVVTNPTALFDTTTESSCEGVEYNFTNQSELAFNYKWIFSDGSESESENPPNAKIGFEKAIEVTLIAINEGCADTVTQRYISPSLFLQYKNMPNVFTPGEDGFNDCFKVTNNPALENCYELIIFNRWGEVIYRKPEDGPCWKGDIPGTEKKVPEGTYYYIFRADGKERSGTIKLIR